MKILNKILVLFCSFFILINGKSERYGYRSERSPEKSKPRGKPLTRNIPLAGGMPIRKKVRSFSPQKNERSLSEKNFFEKSPEKSPEKSFEKSLKRVSRGKHKSYKQYDLKSATKIAKPALDDFLTDTTVGSMMNDMDLMSQAPVELQISPVISLNIIKKISKTTPIIKKEPILKKNLSKDEYTKVKVRFISPRQIGVLEVEEPPENLKVILINLTKQFENKEKALDKGAAEVACAKFEPLLHCEIVNVSSKSQKHSVSTKWSDNKEYSWNTAHGSYGRVVFGYIEAPKENVVLQISQSPFTNFFKVPSQLHKVRILFHGGGNYEPKYLLGGTKISVVVKSHFRNLYVTAEKIWEREREMYYALSKELWTNGNGEPIIYIPTVFSIHHTDPKTNKQQVLFPDLKGRTQLVSELLIMERISGSTMHELVTYMHGELIRNWLDNTDQWYLWLKASFKLQWLIFHATQSFFASGYLLYMHCDLNRSNIIVHIPSLTSNHQKNLQNIIALTIWEIRIIDISFCWVPSVKYSRNMVGPCRQINNYATFSDTNLLSVSIQECIKSVYVGLKSKKNSPTYQKMMKIAKDIVDSLDNIPEWWSVAVYYYAPNPKYSLRYKHNRLDQGHTFNESIEGLMKACDSLDGSAKKVGFNIPFQCFSPESYLRGYLHLSFRLSKLGLCLRKSITVNSSIITMKIPTMSYFDFAISVLNLDFSLRETSRQCIIMIPKIIESPEGNKVFISIAYTLPDIICRDIKNCVTKIESHRSFTGDKVLKPALAVVTAENYESDLCLNEFMETKKYQISLLLSGMRIFGRFQGLEMPEPFNKAMIINFMDLINDMAQAAGIQTLSEQNIMELCIKAESQHKLETIFTMQNIQFLIKYAESYKLVKICQVFFKLLPNTSISLTGQSVTQEYPKKHSDKEVSQIALRIIPKRKSNIPVNIITENSNSEQRLAVSNFSELYKQQPYESLMFKKYDLQDAARYLIKSHQDKEPNKAFDINCDSKYGLILVPVLDSYYEGEGNKQEYSTLNGDISTDMEYSRNKNLKEMLIFETRKHSKVRGEEMLKYQSIELLCSEMSNLIDCGINKNLQKSFENFDNRHMTVISISNSEGIMNISWEFLQGKYGSVGFGILNVPSRIDEIFIKSSLLVNSNKIEYKVKNIGIWFYGNNKLSPSWLLEKSKFVIAVKSPFYKVHSKGDKYWNREKILSILISLELWTSSKGDLYQIAPSTFSIFYNVKDFGSDPFKLGASIQDIPLESGTKKKRISNTYMRNIKPLFTNYLFMERLHGETMNSLLYYLRSQKLFEWLQEDYSMTRWDLWYYTILTLLYLSIHTIQSFAASGFSLYMHCDINFGNIIYLLPPISQHDHEYNLLNIINMKLTDVRIIDYSFLYIFHYKDSYNDCLDMDKHGKSMGFGNLLGERNLPNVCKEAINSAIFNDPNYVSIFISELLKGSSILYNMDKIFQKKKEQNMQNQGLQIENNFLYMDKSTSYNNKNPLVIWNDQENKVIRKLSEIHKNIQELPEWSQIGLSFIPNDNPFKRWVSKQNQDKGKMATFNQGIEAYIATCNILAPTFLQSYRRLVSLNNFGIVSEISRLPCFSLESYLRGYTFLSYNVVKLALCMRKSSSKIGDLSDFLQKRQLSYFQFAMLVLEYYTWLTIHNNNLQESKRVNSIVYRSFFIKLKTFCNEELLKSDRNSNLQANISFQAKNSRNIYYNINEDQDKLIQRSIMEFNLQPAFALILQRLWYRIQGLVTLNNSEDPIKILLLPLIDFMQKEFTEKDELLDDLILLNACNELYNRGVIKSILRSDLYVKLARIDQSICDMLIKPANNLKIY
ncbi:hypothetical protein ACR3K2_22990 [Cryptosporidium serpentis]